MYKAFVSKEMNLEVIESKTMIRIIKYYDISLS